VGDPNDNEANHQTDGKDPLQGGPLSRGRADPAPKRGTNPADDKDGERDASTSTATPSTQPDADLNP